MNTNNYIDDVFTKVDDKINIDANNLNINCITSKNNKFSLDSDGNLIVNSITSIQNPNYNIEQIADLIYPVGSIYMSTTNINPSTLFGGTWEQIKDRFLLAAGDTYQNGTTGGEANHTLTINELPSHNHTANTTVNSKELKGSMNVRQVGSSASNHYEIVMGTAGIVSKTGNVAWSGSHALVKDGSSINPCYFDTINYNATHNHTTSTSINATGGSKAHNNMPPYIAVYMYKRVS